MKQTIEYFFNIYPNMIYETNGKHYFFIDDIKYYFINFDRNINELDDLVNLTNELYYKNIPVHTFIKNKDNNFYVNYDNKIYVLLRVNYDENEAISIYDLIKFNNYKILNNKPILEYKERWSKTVDIFEVQVGEYNKEYPIVLSVFEYYVGLAENAISYLNNIELPKSLYLTHNRVNLNLTYEYLYNPMNLIYDYKIRDISEYIKEKFFFGTFDEEEIILLLDNNINYLDIDDIKLLYSRLLYPTYFFDMFNKIINGEELEANIKKIINLSESYEKFLKELYFHLKSKYNIEAVNWIVK